MSVSTIKFLFSYYGFELPFNSQWGYEVATKRWL